MKRTIAPEGIETRRRSIYRLTPGQQVRSLADAGRFIRQVGFCWLFAPSGGVPELPSLFEAVKGRRGAAIFEWDADSDRVWIWKNELPAERRAYYGKGLMGRPGFASLDLLPALLAAVGEPSSHFKRLYAHGAVSGEARRIYDALERNGPMPTMALRSSAGLGAKGDNTRYHRGLDDLQRRFLVMPVGATNEVGNWSSQIFELVERWYPDQAREALTLDLEQARRVLARRYLKTVLAAKPAALARLLCLSREQTQALAAELVACRYVRVEGEWLVKAR